MALTPQELVDHDRYPVAPAVDDEARLARRASVVAEVRAALAEDGCAVLPGFLSEPGHAALLAEARQREPLAFYNDDKQALAFSHLNGTNVFTKDIHVAFAGRAIGFTRQRVKN